VGAGCFYTIKWMASDNVGIISRDGGTTFMSSVSTLSSGARRYNPDCASSGRAERTLGV